MKFTPEYLGTSTPDITLSGDDGADLNVGAGGVLGSAAFTDVAAYAPTGTVELTTDILKGDGAGSAIAAVAGTDFLSPSGSGAGLAGVLKTSNNLSEVIPATARANLGLGTLATQSGTFSGTSSGSNTGDQANISGNAATVTTNANLTGPITSAGNATSIASQTGTGTTFVMSTQPSISQEAWIAPTLTSPWVNFGSSSTLQVAGYMKDSMGFVHLRGGIKNGSTSVGSILFTLPAGYRPLGPEIFVTATNTTESFQAIVIDTSGNVKLDSTANSSLVTLSGITFSVN